MVQPRRLSRWWSLNYSFFLYFLRISWLEKHINSYYVHDWQVSPQLSCGNTCRIWMWSNTQIMLYKQKRPQQGNYIMELIVTPPLFPSSYLVSVSPGSYHCPIFHKVPQPVALVNVRQPTAVHHVKTKLLVQCKGALSTSWNSETESSSEHSFSEKWGSSWCQICRHLGKRAYHNDIRCHQWRQKGHYENSRFALLTRHLHICDWYSIQSISKQLHNTCLWFSFKYGSLVSQRNAHNA